MHREPGLLDPWEECRPLLHEESRVSKTQVLHRRRGCKGRLRVRVRSMGFIRLASLNPKSYLEALLT